MVKLYSVVFVILGFFGCTVFGAPMEDQAPIEGIPFKAIVRARVASFKNGNSLHLSNPEPSFRNGQSSACATVKSLTQNQMHKFLRTINYGSAMLASPVDFSDAVNLESKNLQQNLVANMENLSKAITNGVYGAQNVASRMASLLKRTSGHDPCVVEVVKGVIADLKATSSGNFRFMQEMGRAKMALDGLADKLENVMKMVE